MPDRVTATATIVAADVGATRSGRVCELVGARAGRVVGATPERVVAAFVAASQALQVAVELQELAAVEVPGDAPRVGVAAGDVTWDGDDCFGAPVSGADQLRRSAQAGQILASGAVRVLAGERAAAGYEPLGLLAPPALQGLDVVAVRWERQTPAPTAHHPPPMARALAGPAGPSFVGRSDVLRTLVSAWDDAAREAGRIVLVGGEAGTGKTRLAAELARRLHAGGAAVLYGACDDDLALPYQPWVHALDPVVPGLVDGDPYLVARLGPLVPLLASAERLVPGVVAPAAGDVDADRYRRYGAFLEVLEAAAARWPTLLVLDDLHWAGPQTLALLRHLVRSGLPRGLLTVATFRDTGDEIGEPLAACLADLRRVDGARRLRLDGLDRDAVERFVAVASGGDADTDLDADLRAVARVLADRTDGNAFFVGELWDHLVASGAVVAEGGRYVVRSAAAADGVPDGVREVVAARLVRLSVRARHVVDVAAIAGMEVELAVLALAAGATVDLAKGDVGVAAEELVAAGLLTAAGPSPPAYRFTHAIVRDTVAASVAPGRRAELHLAVAHGLEAVHESDPRPVLADLARHFTAAAPVGPVDRAVHHARRAAGQATRAAAYDEAAGHLRAVLAVPLEPAERAELLVELGLAGMRGGFYDESRRAYAEAFELADEAGLVDVAVDAALGFETATHFPGLPGGPAVGVVGRAITLAVTKPPATRTRLRASFARALAVAGRTAEGVAMAESTIVDARAVDDPESLAVALQALMTAIDDPVRELALSGELSDLAAGMGDPWSSLYASANELRALVMLGRLDEAADALERHRALSASERFATYQFMATAFEAVLDLAAGRFAEAEAAAGRGQDLASSSESPYGEGVYGLQMFAIRRAEGRLREVAPVVRLLAGGRATWRPGLAAIYVELDLLDEARAVFEELAPGGFAAVPRDAIWPACLTFLAEAGLVVGDADTLQVLYGELARLRGQLLMVGFTTCFGPADRLAGALAARLGRHGDADDHFVDALALATQARSPVWTAEAQRDWAVALAARGDLARAAELDAQAKATARRLGMARLAERPDAGTAAAVPGAFRPDGLSEREVEVLRAVAAGLSNREIGNRLFISQNTVANHVRSILQKSGCANRTEAAGYAVRHGLIDHGRE